MRSSRDAAGVRAGELWIGGGRLISSSAFAFFSAAGTIVAPKVVDALPEAIMSASQETGRGC